MKALALGAHAVLIGRPVMWGLAAYGADGVQAVLEMLQTELGRVMGCCGTPNLAAITRTHVRVHAANQLVATPRFTCRCRSRNCYGVRRAFDTRTR